MGGVALEGPDNWLKPPVLGFRVQERYWASAAAALPSKARCQPWYWLKSRFQRFWGPLLGLHAGGVALEGVLPAVVLAEAAGGRQLLLPRSLPEPC